MWDTRDVGGSRHPSGHGRYEGERGGGEHPDAEEGDADGVKPPEGGATLVGGVDGLDIGAKRGAQALDARRDPELST